MPDMDGFREATNFGIGQASQCNFGIGQASQCNDFHVKGASNLSWGMKDRLSRIFNPKTGKAVLLAFDHGFIMGPTSGLERIDLNIVPLVQYADCLMCTRGILQSSIPANVNKPIDVYARYPAKLDTCQREQADLLAFGCRYDDSDRIEPQRLD